jgi:hypothetical protein
LANIKTRSLKAGARPVLQDNIKIRTDNLGANTVVKVLTKIQMVNRGVKTVVVANIPTRTLELDANPVVKVIIKTKLDNQGVKHAVMDSILTRMPDLDAKNVELVGMGVMDYIVATNGLHPLLLMYLTSTLVTNINRVGQVLGGKKIVGLRVMHKENQAVDMVITTESVAIIRITFFVLVQAGGVIHSIMVGMHKAVPDVTHHQVEGLD